MPLRDHFHPPLSKKTSWDMLHGAWPVSVSIVDVVTEKHFNLCTELLELIDQSDPAFEPETPASIALMRNFLSSVGKAAIKSNCNVLRLIGRGGWSDDCAGRFW